MRKRLSLYYTIIITTLVIANSCNKDYSFERSAGSLKDSSNNCIQFLVNGSFSKDVNPVSNAYVTANILVTKIGYYSVHTNVQNGFQFADSGIFTNLGLHQVQLKPMGKPLKDTLTTFLCSYNNTSCYFSIDVGNTTNKSLVSADTMALNTWKFTDSSTGGFHHGIFADGNANYGATLTGYVLTLIGWMDFRSPSDTVLVAQIYMPHSTIDTGYYITQDSNAFLFALNTGIINHQARYFSANLGTPDTLTFHIISFNQQTQNVLGSFSGKATTPAGTGAYIRNGFFYAHVK